MEHGTEASSRNDQSIDRRVGKSICGSQPDDTCAQGQMGQGHEQDRRAKLVAKLLQQKEVVAPGYCAPKTKSGKDKKEAWVNALKDATYVFYVRYGHSELELAPGLKGVAVANISEIPAIIDRVIEVVNSGHFDAQMKQISENFAAKKKSKSASVQQAA
jgi:hypothetical protein